MRELTPAQSAQLNRVIDELYRDYKTPIAHTSRKDIFELGNKIFASSSIEEANRMHDEELRDILYNCFFYNISHESVCDPSGLNDS